MSIIIRLQNLPWSANALDIRQYFTGLQIPEGGVHIVGGELGDAFIAFSTDEDARQAFIRSDGQIKSVQIKLMLSSRTEMQRVIEQARTQSMAAFMLPANTPMSAPLPAAVPAVIPAAVPEIKRDSKERDSDKKKDRKRSRTRSKSRDRRDRSRDRKDRRHRDRSRSRSRDRRDRRRRDRSKSRNRSRDKDTRRKDRAKSPKRDDREESMPFQRDARKSMPEVWASRATNQQPILNIIPPAMTANDSPGILGGGFPMADPIKRNMGGNSQAQNGFTGNTPQRRNQAFGNDNQQKQRESWPSANVVPSSGVPLAVSAAQRKNLLETLKRATDNFQAAQNNNNSRGSREEPQRDFRARDNSERNKAAPPSRFEGSRNDNNGRKSRFEDNDSTPIDSCISMEPFYGSYGDLRRFFNGLSINYRGIKVINDETGRKTGVCLVQFRNSHIKNDALKMDQLKLNNIAIKIQHISDKTFEGAVDRYNPRMDDDKGGEDQFGRSRNLMKFFKNPAAPAEPQIKDFVCLKVEGLPTFVKEQDILHIFSQHPLISLHLNFKPKGGSVAYVKFSCKEVAKLALEEKSHHVISGKPVTVKPCKDEEFEQVNKEQDVTLEVSKPKDIGTDCLSISKLPSKTNDRDISDFFSDIGVIPTKIHLMSNNLGFTGQAYCEFETDEEATRAATKNTTVLGQNAVSVLPINRSEMEGILGNSLPHPGTAAGLPLPPGTPLPPIRPTEPALKPELLIKPSDLTVTRSEPFAKPEHLPEVKSVLAERIDDAPVKQPPITPVPQQVPVLENKKPLPQLLQPLIRPARPERPPMTPERPLPVMRDQEMLEFSDRSDNFKGPDDRERFNGPAESPGNFNFVGPRSGGLDNRDSFNCPPFNGPRGGPDAFNGPRGGPDAFNGPRGGPDAFNGPRGGPDAFNGPRGGPDSFNGPRGGPNGPRGGPDAFNGPRGGPDVFNGPRDGPDSFNGRRGNRDVRDNYGGGPRGLPDLRDTLARTRGGPGPRESRFGPRLDSRFSGPDENPRFNPHMDDGPAPRFNSHMDDGPGPRFNPRRDEGGRGFIPHMDDEILDDIPGCTVYMENVPYKASTNEILDFFEGFNCTNNVSRRYNPNNTPSSEAKVTFYTADDAYRAVRELDGAKIWGRAIYLKQS